MLPRFDVMVVGGGAAGMMAAIAAASESARTLLLEKTNRLGFKIAIAGGGRCNVTNARSDARQLAEMVPGNGRFMLDAFRRFSSQDVLELLAKQGVRTKIEPPYDKVFPTSDQSADVIRALEAEMRAQGVAIRREAPVGELWVENGRIQGVALKSGERIQSRAVIVCVGGQSLSRSGSTGDGYPMARAVGHHVTDLVPSLVPLRVDHTRDLAGVALRGVTGRVYVNNKLADRPWTGDMLFTHTGLSGPIILQLSRAACQAVHQGQPADIRIDVTPDLRHDDLNAWLAAQTAAHPKQQIGNSLSQWLPKSASEAFLQRLQMAPDKRLADLGKGDRQRLVDNLKAWRFVVTGWHSFEAAEVTAGGVDLSEIDPRTFASRLVRGLYFAGEVLDVDGYVGGYNFQCAWSSGWVAGQSAAQQALDRQPEK